MNWFQCPASKSKSMIEAKAVIGDAGLWQIACLFEEAQVQDIWELSVELIAGWIKIKRDRAQKILPFAQKMFDESRKIFRETSEILSKSQEILSKSEDFTLSNPRGSIKDKSNYLDLSNLGDLSSSTHVEENIIATKKIEPEPLKPNKKATTVPEDFQVTEQMELWATENSITAEEIKQETPNFLDHHTAKGSRFLCWVAAWRTWMRNSKKFNRPKLVPMTKPRQIGSNIPGNQIVPACERNPERRKL